VPVFIDRNRCSDHFLHSRIAQVRFNMDLPWLPPGHFGNVVPGALAPVLAIAHDFSMAWHSRVSSRPGQCNHNRFGDRHSSRSGAEVPMQCSWARPMSENSPLIAYAARNKKQRPDPHLAVAECLVDSLLLTLVCSGRNTNLQFSIGDGLPRAAYSDARRSRASSMAGLPGT